MKFKIVLALAILFAILTPVSALQIVFQDGKEVLFKGEQAKFEFAIVNAYDNDKMTVETKINRVIIESDDNLKVDPSIFFEGGTLLPKEGLVVQFNVKAEKIGDYRLKVKVYYTKTILSTTEFGATIVTKDVIVRNVLLKVVDSPTIVLKNNTLVLNEVNKVSFKLLGLGDGKVVVEPLFDSKPSIFYFDSLKSANSYFEFIPKKQEVLKFKIKIFNDDVKEYVVSVKPKYIKSNGISAFLQLPDRVLKNDCIKVKLGILNLRKDKIRDVMVKFVGNGTAIPREAVLDSIDSGEQKYLEFKVSPKNEIKFFIIYFDMFGNAHPLMVEKKVEILDSDLLKIVNVSVKNGVAYGKVANFGEGKLLDVTLSCGDKEVFIGTINPHSSKSFEIDVSGKSLVATAKNEIGKEIKVEKVVKVRASSISVSEVWIFLLAILVVLVLLDFLRRRRV